MPNASLKDGSETGHAIIAGNVNKDFAERGMKMGTICCAECGSPLISYHHSGATFATSYTEGNESGKRQAEKYAEAIRKDIENMTNEASCPKCGWEGGDQGNEK